MNRLLRFLSLALVMLLVGCTAMMESSSYGSGDLYVTNNRERVTKELTALHEAQKAEAEIYRSLLSGYSNSSSTTNYNTILANDYESAYARRLYGFSSPTYRLPASYYNLATSDAMRYASAYDPAFYNIMVSGDQVWVEPKYLTSMFGSWGATNITFGIYSSPWAYGWGGYPSPYYGTMWGYPHYSWYGWNWNMCYNPYHCGFGYYAGYYPHFHGAHYPHYRPSNKPSDRLPSYKRSGSATRYTLPTSNKITNSATGSGRVGTATNRDGGARSSGMNSSRVNSGSRSSSTTNRATTNGSVRGSSSSVSRSTVSSSLSSSRYTGGTSTGRASSGGVSSSRR